MSKIRIYGDTSGYIDLTAPAVADNSALSVGDIATAADLSALSLGKVLQIQYGTSNDNFTTTGGNIQEYAGLQVGITPINSSSTIVCIASVATATSGSGRLQTFIKYGTTQSDNIGTTFNCETYVGFNVGVGTNGLYQTTFMGQTDQIGSTNTQYFKLNVTKHDGGTGYINSTGGRSHILVAEIAA